MLTTATPEIDFRPTRNDANREPADAAVVVEGVAGADDAAADLAAEVDVEGEDGAPTARFRRHRQDRHQFDEDSRVHLVCWPKTTRRLKVASNHYNPTQRFLSFSSN